MDTKSLAKSKRAHSQHNKKHHQTHKVKGAASSVVPPGTSKAPAKVVKEKARPALASNWDRYEDADDPMMENQIEGQPSDVVPKSKGADYAYLISEAKSQNSARLSSDIFPSLDDFVSDFGHGKEIFFGVRGESLLSSIQNDSFLVEDKTSANYEASFLSLNMHALAKQLTKIDLPKRLFMEADLFVSEQHSEHQTYDHPEVTSSTKSMNPMVHHPTPDSDQESVANSSADQPKLKAETELDMLLDSEHQAYDDHEVTSSTKSMNPTLRPSTSNTDQSKLKAETELDMLLDTFDDNMKVKDKASSTTVDFDIDGTLDDLLKETSTLSVVDQNDASHVSKSPVLDDFDSWLDTI
ncbi:hypothetical protein QVD17_32159 [Tagetes erecta]|uniref:Uncharacterized protein n=1 Tax=Tagetes erecta TaxID=13708 RepID=A0AAD8K5Q3_TARER|nr:hypothetical protein QVD17_32159 [Tagetes erecta]